MTNQQLMLGRLPAESELVKLEFKDYASTKLLPDPPDNFGHEQPLTGKWGMLGNDQAGCCYVSAAMHNILLWNSEAGVAVPFSDATALAYYSELTLAQNGTAYDPAQADPATGENPTDTGIVVAKALPLLRSVGIPDDTGKRHKIGGFVKLEPGNTEQLWYATYYFDGVFLGIGMAAQWMQLFQQQQYVWPALPNPKWIGGHCITSVAYRDGRPNIVSWGLGGVELTKGAYVESNEETYAVISEEKMINGVDLEGLNLTKMQDDIQQLEQV